MSGFYNTSAFHCNLWLRDLLNQLLTSHMMTQPNKAYQARLMHGPAGGVTSRICLFLLTPSNLTADLLSA